MRPINYRARRPSGRAYDPGGKLSGTKTANLRREFAWGGRIALAPKDKKSGASGFSPVAARAGAGLGIATNRLFGKLLGGGAVGLSRSSPREAGSRASAADAEKAA